MKTPPKVTSPRSLKVEFLMPGKEWQADYQSVDVGEYKEGWVKLSQEKDGLLHYFPLMNLFRSHSQRLSLLLLLGPVRMLANVLLDPLAVFVMRSRCCPV